MTGLITWCKARLSSTSKIFAYGPVLALACPSLPILRGLGGAFCGWEIAACQSTVLGDLIFVRCTKYAGGCKDAGHNGTVHSLRPCSVYS